MRDIGFMKGLLVPICNGRSDSLAVRMARLDHLDQPAWEALTLEELQKDNH